jgi:type IV pilus assembly protein PilA
MNNLSIRKMTEVSKKKKKGFTLIELIIVIAIIAILAAMAIPKFGQIRENANQKADLATAKNIATIVAQEVADGSIDTGDTGVVSADTTPGSKLDGTVTPKALAAGTATSFTYTVNATSGNISITYTGGDIVYGSAS